MNQADISLAIVGRTRSTGHGGMFLAYTRPVVGGLARVRVVETGIAGGGSTTKDGILRRDSSRVQVVQATFEFANQALEGGVIVHNRTLSEWTSETEHTFSILNDRESFRDDMQRYAAEANVDIAGTNPISGLVLLTGVEFRRICELLAPVPDEDEQDIEDAESEMQANLNQPEAAAMSDATAERERRARSMGLLP
jgi:hypothetical protein